MATYLPPTENLPIFDPAVFITNEEALTYNEAIKSFVAYPYAQGAETLQTTDVNGTLGVYGISTFNEEVIVQTSHSQTALSSFRVKDNVSSQSIVFNPNAVNNTYNGIVEASDAVITTSNNSNGLVLTNTNSTTTNGLRIATTKTTIGNGGGGVDIPTNNITFDSTASNPINMTSTNDIAFNRGIVIGTNGVANSGTITFPNTGGSFSADFASGNNFRFITNVGSNTTIWATAPVTVGDCNMTYFNSNTPANSSFLQVGVDSTDCYIKSNKNGTGSLLPINIYSNGIQAISINSTTANITLNTATTANQNISLTGTAKLKYPTGTAGQVLISDATGLLTLGSPTLSVVNGTLPANGSALAYVPAGQYVTYANISLPAGTWNVRGLAGISPSATTTVNTVIIGFGTTTNAVPNIYSVTQYYNTATTGGSNSQVTPIETIITVASTTTYYLIMWVSYSGAPAWSVPSTGGQQLFAIRIA